MSSVTRHLTFLQWGDYREAFHRFAGGGPETYVAQRYSVDHVADLAKAMRVSVVCLPGPVHDDLLPNGVRSIGLGYPEGGRAINVLFTLQRLNPTHFVVATPHLPALMWGVSRHKRVLPLFADSFIAKSVYQSARNRTLAMVLSCSAIPLVANHNVPASLDLVRIGVDSSKVVPWDWPPQDTPQTREPKRAPSRNRPISLMFVGHISESKGVGDAIRAMAVLKEQGVSAKLSIGGSGQIEEMRNLADSVGVSDEVRFLGRVPNQEVIVRMREHDLIVIPSRYDSPEGLPMTIYEGLCSRSPLLVSDHPMFSRALRPESAVMFKAANPASMAAAVRDLLAKPLLYERLSRDAVATWESIQCPVKWGDLLDGWLRDSEDDRAYFRAQSIRGRGIAP